MTFRDQLSADLDIFFDKDEFAIEATYNGKPINLVPETTMLQSTSLPGVLVPGMTIFIMQDQVATCKQGDKVVAEGVTYYVAGMPMLDGGVWTVQINRETTNLSYGV